MDQNILNEFYRAVGVGVIYFGNIEDELKRILLQHIFDKKKRKKIVRMQMGNVLNEIKRINIFAKADINYLIKHKNYRNDIVHHAQDVFWSDETNTYERDDKKLKRNMIDFLNKFDKKWKEMDEIYSKLVDIREQNELN